MYGTGLGGLSGLVGAGLGGLIDGGCNPQSGWLCQCECHRQQMFGYQMQSATWATGSITDLTGLANSEPWATWARQRRERELGVFVWDDVQ